jgi:hypothetical protein
MSLRHEGGYLAYPRLSPSTGGHTVTVPRCGRPCRLRTAMPSPDDVTATALTETRMGRFDAASFGAALDVSMRAFGQVAAELPSRAVMNRWIVRHMSRCLELSDWYRPQPEAEDMPSLSSRSRMGAPRSTAPVLSMCSPPGPPWVEPCRVRRWKRAGLFTREE